MRSPNWSSRVASPENISRRGVNNSQDRPSRLFEEGDHTVPRSPDAQKRALFERLLKRERARKAKLDVAQSQGESASVDEVYIYSIPERFTALELGRQPSELEPELPVRAYKDGFLDSVARNQITICTAETGAGKSTQLPQYLLETGYIVNMTQPRRISASLVAGQVQKELTAVLGVEAAGLVGCHTAGENTVVEGKTRITVLTDGLRLVQEFGQRDELDNEVLIIDEVHERNFNIDMLVAQVKRIAKQKPSLRIVILSATMQAEKLATYFESGVHGGSRPPIIEIPGRNFEVDKKEAPDSTVVEEAVKYAEDGHNTLIFLPGVREIGDTIDAINEALIAKGILNATILPLHSKLSKQEQEAVMAQYPGPKIICATNIAQTSITIPDVTRVIMSGLERRTEIDAEGVSSLNLRPVSRADMIQQAGRCGRVENGEAVLTRLNKETQFISHDDKYERTDYAIPEILRTDVDRNVLLAASIGLDFAEIDFFSPVEPSVIKRSKHALRILGALDDDGKITSLGRRMIVFPMRPMYSRMVTFAEDQKSTAKVRTYVAAMVSSMEVGGMPSWLKDSSREWREQVNETDNSDHLTQLRLFIAAQQMSERDKYHIGLDVHNVERAQELYRKVCKRTGVLVDPALLPPTDEEVDQIRQSVLAGLIDYVYIKNGDGYVRADGTTGEIRTKSNRSTVKGLPPVAVAIPMGVERTRKGLRTKESIVQDLTVTTMAKLGEVAVGLCEWNDAELRWSHDRLQRVQRQFFKCLPTGLFRNIEAEATPEALREAERRVMERSGSALTELKEIKNKLETLMQLTTEPVPVVTQDDLIKMIRDAMAGQLLALDHVDQIIRENMDKQNLHLDELISPEARKEIREKAPTRIDVGPNRLTLEYHFGIPRHRVTDPSLAENWPDEVHLPDGRPVQFIHNKKVRSIAQLKELASTKS
ncbi:MAG: helicase-related protein [Candidatus Saccharibacteria bacterium]